MGRPKIFNSTASLQARDLYLSGRYSQAEIQDRLGLSRSSFFNYKKAWNLGVLWHVGHEARRVGSSRNLVGSNKS